MCGRYDNRVAPSKVVDHFSLKLDDTAEKLLANHNVCPTQTVPVITNTEPETLTPVKWGLVPFWAKDDKGGAKMINARAETLLEKPAFKNPLSKRRCLVPAAAFYEWRKDPTGKVPLRFSLADDDVFAFAGLWEVWRPAESGEPLRSCTIITTSANELVMPAHDRMPVILPREAERVWLDMEVPPEEAVSLLKPYPAERMRAVEVVSGTLEVPRDGPNSA